MRKCQVTVFSNVPQMIFTLLPNILVQNPLDPKMAEGEAGLEPSAILEPKLASWPRNPQCVAWFGTFVHLHSSYCPGCAKQLNLNFQLSFLHRHRHCHPNLELLN